MFKEMDINEVDKLLPNINLIDIRTEQEVKTGKIKFARHIEMNGLLFNANQFLDKDKQYYIYCHAGARSHNTCSLLSSQGYHVVDLLGGIMAYKGEKE